MKLKLAALALLASANVSASECGSVTIADMNWSSASLIANVDKFILENAYGCDAELIPGDTMPTTTSMIEKGQPDIAPEIWANSVKEAVDAGVKEGRLVFAGPSLIDGGEEGFWVPKYMVEQYPELKTIEGVKKHAALFKHPENKDVSGFYGCPAGWGCQISASNLFTALKLADANFELIDPGSAAGLSGSIAKSYERKEAWFGYYWAPTAILGKYEMVKVDFGAEVNEAEYFSCTTIEGCESPKVTSYPASPVFTVTSTEFSKKNQPVMEYLEKRGFKNSDMNKLLAWMEQEQADSEDAMFYFFENYPTVWKSWLSTEAAEKVAAAL
ncbi:MULTISPECIES: ABC transporter substrate-binding protein [unclassified Vibrio]|uniref:ABC transporter substrate-binding protein n=1 Tax=unclassified Vibrio TaxID=2614977 RepID=UPI00189C9963|nr:ABC transporter substrate-binding protein [Vibrio sp. VB16]UGA57645.1 ABC transporter substrate-binding protein [Vibrio sp. VB16]